ncbi:hypothetical protein PSN45_003496 [Yamadazyma tenuis]|uniref:Flavin reductase like domain-containing protein n=1 Tax=Candida tenuis (strain ATCC 10573 / BCRC 21748 / CBS 615 / JCM 9827 / NBRC 10315 / NRRL Y-1498 / VKM Y-70) TaxID=590646 RepID=G3AXY0_CANTC|nr:uncharacterized protein CANTEDRAFT_92045 [Yamadazyma tenuis ATCC 10573]EGV65720.1 hypothetical protein CANTEDRAFT_92045 [Yamadazyma tenuis ATCC 10573]WEJ95964.1 hypothetical protein PSN45_003496 [Yamadazyma tenuis]
MSRVASQAMILTAGFKNHPSSNPSPLIKSLHGMTLSSVSSLSVYPSPLLSFNLHLPSYTSKTLNENNGYVAIHLLTSSRESSRLGRIFASGIKRSVSTNEDEDGEPFHEMATPFKNLQPSEWEMINFEDYQIPILKESECIFVCKKRKVLEIDNHEIWVVNVLDIIENQEQKTGGLVYFNRSFHKVGETLDE